MNEIDKELVPIIECLNSGGIKTLGSCSEHGEEDGYILCEGMLLIWPKENQIGKHWDRYYQQFNSRAEKREKMRYG